MKTANEGIGLVRCGFFLFGKEETSLYMGGIYFALPHQQINKIYCCFIWESFIIYYDHRGGGRLFVCEFVSLCER